MLQVRISNAADEEIYSLKIRNTTPALSESGLHYLQPYAAYTAELSGPGLAKPLVVRLSKFNRKQGAAKLVSRVLGRFFTKHMDLLVNFPLKEKHGQENQTRETG